MNDFNRVFRTVICIFFASNLFFASDFRTEQKRYPRVRTAYAEKEQEIKRWLAEKQIESFAVDIFIRVFKKEAVLEVWVKKKDDSRFLHLIDYAICDSSGTLGPKRKEGDLQVPEGCYHIDRFNPASRFYLSLGINYPNRSDRIRGDEADPGSDVFIHGSCVTIGCVPITDDKIKELYVLAVEAKNSGQDKIPVHIFPVRMDDENFDEIKEEFSEEQKMLNFWEDLKPIYDHFEARKILPDVSINSRGLYVIGN